jgi:hypothetical protein
MAVKKFILAENTLLPETHPLGQGPASSVLSADIDFDPVEFIHSEEMIYNLPAAPRHNAIALISLSDPAAHDSLPVWPVNGDSAKDTRQFVSEHDCSVKTVSVAMALTGRFYEGKSIFNGLGTVEPGKPLPQKIPVLICEPEESFSVMIIQQFQGEFIADTKTEHGGNLLHAAFGF